uniref:P2X purinoreceptor 7 intracellular domain-containing protein n=1 Tax=Sander lucioperca TaxID=283035 RepID=A0A8C9Y7P0_SANLU
MDVDEETEVSNVGEDDGPQAYNCEPPRRDRGQGEIRGQIRGRNNGQRRKVELWCQQNQWRIGQGLVPVTDITCLTLHSGFDACCLNPFSLQVAYLNFRQEYGLSKSTLHPYHYSRQFRYTAYRQVVRWAYGFLGREIRKVIPACVVAAIRRGFQCPHLGGNE